MTLDTCGHTSPEESELSDLPLFSWRTSKVSSAQSSKEITGATRQEHQWLSMSSENWKDWVTKQRAVYSQRKRQALLTRGNASSSWRSPTTSQIEGHDSEGSQKKQDATEIGGLREEDKHSSTGNLPAPYLEETEAPEEQGARWATPRTAMSKAPRGGGHGEIVQYRIENQVQAPPVESPVQVPSAENQVQTLPRLNHRNSTTSASWKTPTVAEGGKIANQVNQGQLGLSNDPLLESGAWFTPVARDGKDARLRKQPVDRKDGKTRLDGLPRVVLHEENYRGYLNPRWVETLMGVPVGWCDPLWKGDASSCTNRYDELRLLGNGVVPATAEVAIRTLLTRLLGDEA